MSREAKVNGILKTRQYINKPKAKDDVMNALRAFHDLFPKEDTYMYNNGSSQTLLCLSGTVPVQYRGNQYNIPIQIWTFTNHPVSPPLIYVKPTSSMVIKPNKYVDNTGRVYLPYLNQWQHPKSDLYSCINMTCMAFSEECPVYSKQAAPQQPRPPVNTPYPGPSPGYPMPGTAGMPTPYGQQPYSQNYPAVSHHSTPYPTSQASTPYPNPSSYQSHTQNTPPVNVAAHPPERQGSVIEEKHIRASLLSLAEEKLKRRIQEIFQMGKTEIDNLQETKEELESGNRTLQEMIARMKDEKANLTSNISLLNQKTQDAEELLSKMENDSANLSIDDAVITTAPLYNQILTLFAEESAVEDAIYHLSEALRKESIELDQYLKNVRELSRRQFNLRATLQKARATAGLSSDVIS